MGRGALAQKRLRTTAVEGVSFPSAFHAKLPFVPKGVNSINTNSNCLHFGGCWSWTEYLRKSCKKIRAIL